MCQKLVMSNDCQTLIRAEAVADIRGEALMFFEDPDFDDLKHLRRARCLVLTCIAGAISLVSFVSGIGFERWHQQQRDLPVLIAHAHAQKLPTLQAVGTRAMLPGTQ
jgi:hypothetical protein